MAAHHAFAALMAPLGPFEPHPVLAVGASGGADSTALTLLSDGWARASGGGVVAMIVDHGLRPSSAEEAALTRSRFAARGIPTQVLTLAGLGHGPALAARARAARHAVLEQACRDRGILHLLLGHHQGDQAETVLMRRRAGSGQDGCAGMPALREAGDIRILRPLLGIAPARLRAYLRTRHCDWIEDPSNADQAAQRARLRAELSGADPAWRAALLAEAAQAGAARSARDHAIARVLAERVRFSPLGYALLSPGAIDPDVLNRVLRAIGGHDYPLPSAGVAALAQSPRPATLGGVRLLSAGRLGPGLLLVREQPPPPVPAAHGARWDRFRLHAPGLAPGFVIAASKERRPDLPAAVTRVLPCLWRDGVPVAARFRFAPTLPAAGAPF